MLNALRLARQRKPSHLISFSVLRSNHITRKPHSCGIRFAQAASGPNQTEEMDSKKQSGSQSKTMDTMSSFGEGYVTRSDEEGFGGIYGGNKYVSKDDEEEEKVHGDAHEEFDHNQGCEVKEKEKARHQNKVAT